MKAKRILIVVDMQNDFVTGALSNKEAEKIIPAIVGKIESYKTMGYPVFFTRDTHKVNYLDTQEGKKLPVPHCIEGSKGWEIVDELSKYAEKGNIFDKGAFSDINIPKWLEEKLNYVPDAVELCGVCTDICVISNGMILKAAWPETEIEVNGNFCAGVTPETHENALMAMECCQINITR